MTASGSPLRAQTAWPTSTKVTLILAGMLTMMAGATVAPAIPAIKDAFAGTAHVELLAGMVLSTHALAILLISPLAGYVGDRFGRKPILLIGMAAFGAGGTSGLYLPNLPTILVGRFVLGIGVALIMTNVTALTGDLFTGTARQKLIGQQAAATTAGGVLIMLGGGALASLGWRDIFLIYLVGLALMLPVVAYVPGLRITAEDTDDQSESSGPVRLGAWLVAPAAGMLAMQVVFYTVPTHLPTRLDDEFGLGPLRVSLVLAAMSLAMAPVAMNFHRIRRLANPPTLMAASLVLMAVGFVMVGAAPNLPVLVGGLMVVANGMAFAMPNVSSWVVALAPPRIRGRATGVVTTALFAGQFLSPIVTQPIVGLVGRQHTFTVLAVVSLLVGVVYLLLGRRARATIRESDVGTRNG